MKYRLARGMVQVDSPAAWLRLAVATPTLLWAPRIGAAVPLRREGRRRAERWWARRAAAATAVDLRIEGREHATGGDPFVIAALHESVFDPVALFHLPVDLRFVTRREVLGWPYFGGYLRASGQIAVTPERGRAAYRSLLAGATAAIADGDSVVVFPQGTLLGLETRFQPGAFRLAERLGAPLLPVVLTGGHRVWERPFSPVVRRGQQVGVRVLAPIPPDRIAREGPEATRDRVEREMKRHALDGSLPAPRRFDPDRDGTWDEYRYEIDPAFPDVADRLAELRAGSTGPAGAPPRGPR